MALPPSAVPLTPPQSMSHNTSKSNPPDTEHMFSAIAARYDLCNHLFSFGLDRGWRKKTAALCCNKPIAAALDLCCGTGDMAFALAKTGRVKTITACDISRPMLTLAQQKKRGQLLVSKDNSVAATGPGEVDGKCATQISWLHCPAENTGLPNASFDLIACAFGLRNVSDTAQTLKEMYRLLRPAGSVCILEFFLPQNKFFRKIYLFYLCHLMPLAARWIAGSPDPWRYLAGSIRQWEKINLCQLLQTAGFQNIAIHPLTFNTVRITTAHKPSLSL